MTRGSHTSFTGWNRASRSSARAPEKKVILVRRRDRGTRITRIIIFLAIGPPCLRIVVHWSTGHSYNRLNDRLPTSGGGLPKLAEQGPCDFPLSNNRVVQVIFIPKTSQQVHGSPRRRDLGADNTIASWITLCIPQSICRLPDYPGQKPGKCSYLFVCNRGGFFLSVCFVSHFYCCNLPD
jgi:hypothetical protein